ncbi:MAG: hypothetical protein ABI406_08800 [Ktedonobacteraceae bacterium]
MIRVRPYVPDDREFVLSLAPRLAIGIPPWRDPQKMIATAQGWITGNIEQHGKKRWSSSQKTNWENDLASQLSHTVPILQARVKLTSENWRPVKRPSRVELAKPWPRLANNGHENRATGFSPWQLVPRISGRLTSTDI